MLLTRSIRRKLASGLALVGILVALSTTCSMLGLISYRRTVNDLELSIGKLPRRAELISSVSQLLAELSPDLPAEGAPEEMLRQSAQLQEARFAAAFHRVRQDVNEFKQSWQQLPENLRHQAAEQNAYRLLFRAVDEGLSEIERGIPLLGQAESRQLQTRVIWQTITNMIVAAKNVPDPANRLGERLQEAKADYQLHLRLVSVLGAVSVAVLISLLFWGYQLIFVPIRKLQQGVRRIAAGDYSYRFKIGTKCEISELAKAFNEMAMRIQEDRAHKEREVEERSKQLVLSERMAGAGFLAAGVAHEINNPLSVIMTAAYGLDMRLTDDVLSGLDESDRADVREYLGLITSEAERCERITKKLLDFSYGKGEERNRYDVTAILAEVVGMVGHLSRYQDRHITLARREPLHAWVNAPEIKQVILNLVANALDATQPGGYVDIDVREYPEEVEITVEDDGCGMTPEQMQHIFEPFFTTKDVGKGTGLGLSISHRIVRDHGGTLEVESAGPGLGSRFILRLPKTAAKARAA